MNKIYKVIFSRRLGAFVVTSELTKAHSKDSNSVDERRGLVDGQPQHGAWLHRALSFLQSPQLSLRPLVVSLVMGGALGLATPALAQVTYTNNSTTPSSTTDSVKSVVFKQPASTTSDTSSSTNTTTGVTTSTQTSTTTEESRKDEINIIEMLKKITTITTITTTSSSGSSTTSSPTTAYSGNFLKLSPTDGLVLGTLSGRNFGTTTSLALTPTGLQFYNNGTAAGLLSTINNGQTLNWSGTRGFSLNGKVLAYNPSWTSAANTGLTFDGKPITPYYGVNSNPSDGGSTPNWGNYYGQGATGAGAIAIGKNASAANKHAIAIGWNANVVGVNTSHGIAIGGAENPAEAAVAARSSIAMGYNVRLDKAAHSFGFGINLHMGGYRNIAISAAGTFSSPTTVFGTGNTVIGSDNKLEGKSYTKVNDYEYGYNDIVSNAVLGEGNKIVGTAGADATPSGYRGTTGAYRNAIVGMKNKLTISICC